MAFMQHNQFSLGTLNDYESVMITCTYLELYWTFSMEVIFETFKEQT